jgi:uncharacterized protein (UPF0335 family)
MTDQLTPVALPDEHRPADERLQLLIERVERLQEEKKASARTSATCSAR